MKNKFVSLLVVSLGKAPIAGFPHLGLVDRWEMAGNSHDSHSDLINKSTPIFYQIHLKPAAALLTLRSDTIAFPPQTIVTTSRTYRRQDILLGNRRKI